MFSIKKSMLVLAFLASPQLLASSILPNSTVRFTNPQFENGRFSVDVAYEGCHQLKFNLDGIPDLMYQPFDPDAPKKFYLSHGSFAGYCRVQLTHTLKYDLFADYGVREGDPIEILASGSDNQAKVIFSHDDQNNLGLKIDWGQAASVVFSRDDRPVDGIYRELRLTKNDQDRYQAKYIESWFNRMNGKSEKTERILGENFYCQKDKKGANCSIDYRHVNGDLTELLINNDIDNTYAIVLQAPHFDPATGQTKANKEVIARRLQHVEIGLGDIDDQEPTKEPTGICTMDFNPWGNPSVCTCDEDYRYNSKTGLCHKRQ